MHRDKSCLNQAFELILDKFGSAVNESEWSGVVFYFLHFSDIYSMKNSRVQNPS